MPSGSVSLDEVEGLYLYESCKAVRFLLVDGTTKWFPISVIHGGWERDMEEFQIILIESFFINWSEKEDGW